MFDKSTFAALATLVGILAFLPYLYRTLNGRVRPHALSWTLWGTTTLIVFLAQREAGAGVGAWPIGISAMIAYLIAVVASIKRGSVPIATSDWVFFLAALSAIPLWYLTDDPMMAVIVVTAIDVIGFAPTLRKAVIAPESESAVFFSLVVLRNLLVLMALEEYSITTALFPISIGMMCLVVVLLLLSRRLDWSRLKP